MRVKTWLNKNKTLLLNVGAFLVPFGLVLWLIVKLLKKGKGGNMPTGNAKKGLEYSLKKYGREFTENLEKSLRNETAHFSSGQWLKCGTSGMVANTNKFPFGWSYLKKWAEKNGINENQFDTVTFHGTSRGTLDYVKFPDTGMFIKFKADFLANVRNGNVWAWNSTDPTTQAEYKRRCEKIVPSFTNLI